MRGANQHRPITLFLLFGGKRSMRKYFTAGFVALMFGTATMLPAQASSVASAPTAQASTVPGNVGTLPPALARCSAGQQPGSLAEMRACAAVMPGSQIVRVPSTNQYVLVGNSERLMSGANHCQNVGPWEYIGFFYLSFSGTLCWNGSQAWASMGSVNCAASPFPPPGGQCVGTSSGAFNRGSESGIWVNYSILNGLVPECVYPRYYVFYWGQTLGPGYPWNISLGFCH
jgi:hypothetical protein